MKGQFPRAETGDMRDCMESHCWELMFLDVDADEVNCSGSILKM